MERHGGGANLKPIFVLAGISFIFMATTALRLSFQRVTAVSYTHLTLPTIYSV